jgi:hypothetical protein
MPGGKVFPPSMQETAVTATNLLNVNGPEATISKPLPLVYNLENLSSDV